MEDSPELQLAEDTQELLSELGIELAPRRIQGPPKRPFSVDFVRDLSAPDLEALAIEPRGSTVPALKRIHASHHALARCLASGMKQTEAALITGYSTVRVGGLLKDPTFAALVEEYRSEAKSVFVDLAERMTGMSLDAIEVLQDRLHSEPEKFTIPMLVEVVKAFADRTGHGPGQDVNVKVTAQMIDRPPRENYEDWERRRLEQLGQAPRDIKLIN